MPLELERILFELRTERDRIDKAIVALEGIGFQRRPGRPKAATSTPTAGGRRQMSAAARKRLSEAMKKRWAERKRKRP
jgi:hypothetical protein